MNSREKIVQQQFLNDETKVIKRLNSTYKQALKDITAGIKDDYDRIDVLQQMLDDLPENDPKRVIIASQIRSKVYQANYQEALQKQVEGILQNVQTKNYLTVSDYLRDSYDNGFIGAMYDLHGQGIPLTIPIDQQKVTRAVQLESKISQGLYNRLGEDVQLLKKKITAQVSLSMVTGQSYATCAQRLAGYTNIGFNRAVRIARTEGHRVQVTAAMDALTDAKDVGADVLKQWDATLDGRTRESHKAVDGELRELDERFSNGLMFPGDPDGGAAEVVNCRCALLQRARWALDEAELQTLKDRAALYGLDKTQNFEEFKSKYLQTVESRQQIQNEIDADKKRIDDIDVELDKLTHDAALYDSYNTPYYRDADKGQLQDELREIDIELERLDKISDRYYDRPASGTPERAQWREWKRSIDIYEIQDRQIELSSQKASIQKKLDLMGERDIWLAQHPGVNRELWSRQIAQLQAEKVQLTIGIDNKQKQLAALATPIKTTNDPLAPTANAVRQKIGSVECQVHTIDAYGLGDGTSTGTKKTVPVTVYTTPDGAHFVFPKKYNKAHQTLTPEQAVETWMRVPEKIRSKIQRKIEVLDYYNPQDTTWRKRYKNFTHSYATGGDDISMYRHDRQHDLDYLAKTFCHEGGHYIDFTLPGASRNNRYSEQTAWQSAMAADYATSGKKSWRAYGENAATEDFADSIAYYVFDHENFIKTFPERTKLLDAILK